MIVLELPENVNLPVEIQLLTPIENHIMILIGFHAIQIMKEKFIHQESYEIKKKYECQLKQKEEETVALKQIYEEKIITEKEKYDSMLQELFVTEKERNNLFYNEKFQSYENEISLLVKKNETSDIKIASIEKELWIEEECKKHRNTISELRIENEIAIRIKDFIGNQNNELNKYKNLLNDSEKTILKMENNTIFHENQQIQKLQQELVETKESVNNLLLEKERYKNSILRDTIETNNKSMEEITSLLKHQNENLNLNANLNANNENQSQNKSNVRGVEGETFFYNLALKTFCDCSNFDIVEKSKSPHSGDFWLKFEKFTIMVDSKNYIDTPVPLRDRVKLKDDILFHKKNIKIAWLVSMDQPILTFSGYPFMIDIEDGICYCYINSLMKSENPQNLLRMAWYSCNFVYDHLLNIDNEINIIGKYQKNESRIKNILNRMIVQSKERFTIIQQLTENFKLSEIDIRDCLNDEIRDVREQHIEIISHWFTKHVIKKEGGKIKTSDMLKKFLSDDSNKNQGIDADMFKQILRCIPPLHENEIVRGKTDKAQYTIINHSFR